jgi:hypothetical protein
MELKERTVKSLNSMTVTTTYVKHSNKWYKLLEFEGGRFGIKIKVRKPFNPYIIFEGEDLQSIKEYRQSFVLGEKEIKNS